MAETTSSSSRTRTIVIAARKLARSNFTRPPSTRPAIPRHVQSACVGDEDKGEDEDEDEGDVESFNGDTALREVQGGGAQIINPVSQTSRDCLCCKPAFNRHALKPSEMFQSYRVLATPHVCTTAPSPDPNGGSHRRWDLDTSRLPFPHKLETRIPSLDAKTSVRIQIQDCKMQSPDIRRAKFQCGAGLREWDATNRESSCNFESHIALERLKEFVLERRAKSLAERGVDPTSTERRLVIAAKVEVIERPQMSEINPGAWDGLAPNQVRKYYADEWVVPTSYDMYSQAHHFWTPRSYHVRLEPTPNKLEREKDSEELRIIRHASLVRHILAFCHILAYLIRTIEVARGDHIEVVPTSYGVYSEAHHFWMQRPPADTRQGRAQLS
ncbi:hypothetical protein L226DRAFT_527146 [Lentinus tigrinus ALCF2SS1-7]|uniref:uncharacterized protein n=1 Tax=Lentinus tigrinus ALCF2SS1-7 TaxID=1328758 RepID=UPI001166148A|nr:hypothetical protein L226DRAFT_527146 [Lentinus tigrinus ALCF2SS1-7]